MANVKYDLNTKKKIIRLHLEEGHSVKSLSEEYNLGSGTLRSWLNKYREECQTNPETKQQSDVYAENRKPRKQIEELEKENLFLKKAAAFFAKEIESLYKILCKLINSSFLRQ